jgi:Fe-S cluster assembly protein SufD
MAISTLATSNNNAKLYTQHCDKNGTYINIPEDTTIDTPIIICYTPDTTQTLTSFTPHNCIVLGKNSKVQIIEIYLNQQEKPFCTAAHTNIQVQEAAHLTYTLLQQANIADQQNLTLQISQHANSNVYGQIFNYGGSINQITLKAILEGNNTQCTFNALEYSKQAETHTLNLQIEHMHACSTSNVTIRSVVDDQAKCSVYGKILVPPNIAEIKANLQHKTMLLSEQATIESKPQLEIYNDNVSCTHGSSVGRLDEDALLYMSTRGIPTLIAKHLLLQGFIAPIINAVPCTNTRQQLEKLFCPENTV